ncbi:MAG: Gfo/Idh/MocA family oxidoreductase [Deinococcota bacterium]
MTPSSVETGSSGTSSQHLNILLVGVGARGNYWAEVLRRAPDCAAVGFVDPNPDALTRTCERFGERPTFADMSAALSSLDTVDAIIFATPPEGRETQLIAACERKLPMLVEKPLAVNFTTAKHYVELAEQASTPMMVGLNFRYLPVTQVAKQKMADLGGASFGRFTYERYRNGHRPGLNRYPLSMEHPMLWEQSIHHFDLLRYVYGQEPTQVYCQSFNPSWTMYAGHANVSALFDFEDELRVNYQGTWQSAWQQPHFEWRSDCERGVVSQQDQFGELYYAAHTDDSLMYMNLPKHELWISDAVKLLEQFTATVRGDAPLQCSGRDHLKSLAMIEACIQSSDRREAVQLHTILES